LSRWQALTQLPSSRQSNAVLETLEDRIVISPLSGSSSFFAVYGVAARGFTLRGVAAAVSLLNRWLRAAVLLFASFASASEQCRAHPWEAAALRRAHGPRAAKHCGKHSTFELRRAVDRGGRL
jgi:hypothetical protein